MQEIKCKYCDFIVNRWCVTNLQKKLSILAHTRRMHNKEYLKEKESKK